MALLRETLQFKEKIPGLFPNIDTTKSEYEAGGCNIIWFSDTEKHYSTVELRFLNSVDYSFNLGRYYISYPNMESNDHIFTFDQYEEVVRDIIENGGEKYLEYPLYGINHRGYHKL